MKIAALVFAILGALSALSIGMYTYALGSVFVAVSHGNYGGLWKVLSVAIPLACIIGAGCVWSAPRVGGIILLGSAAAILLIAGFNFISFTTLILLGAGGGFALAAAAEPPQIAVNQAERRDRRFG